MKQFDGKVAVITGGASGIGKELAKTAASLRMKLVLADIQQRDLDVAVSEFRAQGVDTIGLRVDVSKAKDIEALAAAAIDTFGKVNLLFNNAGVTSAGFVWEHTESDWDWVLGVNLHGIIHGVRVFTPLMLEQAAKDPSYHGHIVNTASMAGFITVASQGIYNVSKHAAVALSEALHHDLGLVTDQVRCSVVCPAYVSTNIDQCDRYRPNELANETPLTKSQSIALAGVKNSVAAGGLTAEQVSSLTFDSIRNGNFYVFPSPEALGIAARRFADILARRNPSDWVYDIPSLRARREQLIASIREQGAPS
jgi:NAD(P)-dependent dehydrogenase (short-subunit alcohol dehydrogenase family)